MAKRRAVRNEGRDEIEETGFLEAEGEDETLTFAGAMGTPANAHAKKLAKDAAAAKVKKDSRAHFYTMKGAEKVVKVVVKHGGAFEVYVGNLKRHGENLKGLIQVWKKGGEWVEAHQRAEQIAKLRAGLPAEKKR